MSLVNLNAERLLIICENELVKVQDELYQKEDLLVTKIMNFREKFLFFLPKINYSRVLEDIKKSSDYWCKFSEFNRQIIELEYLMQLCKASIILGDKFVSVDSDEFYYIFQTLETIYEESK